MVWRTYCHRWRVVAYQSFCYLIDFVWTRDDWAYRYLEDLPGEFTLMDNNGNRDPLRWHEVHYAEKSLGVCISMDGNKDVEMIRLKAGTL